MGILHSGADVRIADDGRVWVLVPAGVVGVAAQWRAVAVDQIRLDCLHPSALVTAWAVHSISDLGLDVRKLSHLLGLPVRDPERAGAMWMAEGLLRGRDVVVDFEGRELVAVGGKDGVHPFSAFAEVREGKLWPRWPGARGARVVSLEGFPVDEAGVARAMGVRMTG